MGNCFIAHIVQDAKILSFLGGGGGEVGGWGDSSINNQNK
jgi:hypothetical protein